MKYICYLERVEIEMNERSLWCNDNVSLKGTKEWNDNLEELVALHETLNDL